MLKSLHVFSRFGLSGTGFLNSTSLRSPVYWLVVVCAFALSLMLPGERAEAACPIPNSLSNGQVADATAVMDNFNAVKGCAEAAVTPSGSPATGNLTVFSSPMTVTGGNLSGDCTTAGTLAVTCSKTSGVSFSPFATGTDAGQLTGTISVSRFDNGANAAQTTFLRGDGTWAIPPTGTGGSAVTPTIRAASIQSSSANSYSVAWPAGTVAGDVVLIFAEHGYALATPAGWMPFDSSPGSNAQGLVIAKMMSPADITAGSVTITTGGTYNGVFAAVTVVGSSMSGYRAPGSYVRSSSGPTAGGAVTLASGTPLPTDLILAFVGVRGSTDVTFPAGFNSLANITAAGASGRLTHFAGTLGPLGLLQTATSSAAGSGYYAAVVVLR